MALPISLDMYFSEENIANIYHSKIIHRASVGMDRIIPDVFDRNLSSNISIISRKVKAGTYKFTRYRQILISKGRDSNPRVISIPTIRDKLTLACLHSLLQDTFKNEIEDPLLHTLIDRITKEVQSKQYDSYVKVDIHRFYSSIEHAPLFSKLERKITDQRTLDLLESAISTATFPANGKIDRESRNLIGVPEGLSISNILANIYLSDLKQIMSLRYSISYFRYVDDILILCKTSDAENIQNDITALISTIYKLQINQEKTKHGLLSDGVQFLGYEFFDNRICVKPAVIQKIENALEDLFRLRSRSAIGEKLFIWRLNLKITGCIYEGQKYGWLFYYSQLNDLSILYHLDWYVQKLLERFKINSDFKLKHFVRTYFEINKNVSHSTYLLNVDLYDLDDKKKIIATVLQDDNKVPTNPEQVEKLFKEIMFKEIQKLEHDAYAVK